MQPSQPREHLRRGNVEPADHGVDRALPSLGLRLALRGDEIANRQRAAAYLLYLACGKQEVLRHDGHGAGEARMVAFFPGSRDPRKAGRLVLRQAARYGVQENTLLDPAPRERTE